MEPLHSKNHIADKKYVHSNTFEGRYLQLKLSKRLKSYCLKGREGKFNTLRGAYNRRIIE